MEPLSSAARRALMAKAHALHPVVIIGHHGLTDAVMREIDVSLRAHELIKVRVVGDDRLARTAALERICAELDAAAVRQVGKLLVLWRPAPPPETPPGAAAPKKSFTTTRGRPAAGKPPRAPAPAGKPAARRPRQPQPRPPAGAKPAPKGVRARRRRGQT